eukprot:TRINITY_DN6603_c0_g1_i1.p1 TRINITY_DN6603_c0_g1~~TRINITY_DN6603_c0_g1_i1.p1  ORF type:complete len:451 (+),score=84.78 TRINITY_DN6603_c0_g1_i1:40-1392(+)
MCPPPHSSAMAAIPVQISEPNCRPLRWVLRSSSPFGVIARYAVGSPWALPQRRRAHRVAFLRTRAGVVCGSALCAAAAAARLAAGIFDCWLRGRSAPLAASDSPGLAECAAAAGVVAAVLGELRVRDSVPPHPDPAVRDTVGPHSGYGRAARVGAALGGMAAAGLGLLGRLRGSATVAASVCSTALLLLYAAARHCLLDDTCQMILWVRFFIDRLHARLGEDAFRVQFLPLLSDAQCDAIKAEAEEVSARIGWLTSRADAPVRQRLSQLPRTTALVAELFSRRVAPALARHYDVPQSALFLRDGFVIRYTAPSEAAPGPTEDEEHIAGLDLHADSDMLTFNCYLSDPADFGGGGTFVKYYGSVLHGDRGEALLHAGKLLHAGVPISHGTRYQLVGQVEVWDPEVAQLHSRILSNPSRYFQGASEAETVILDPPCDPGLQIDDYLLQLPAE